MDVREKTKKTSKLEFKRTIPAKREDVFEAWTNPEIIAKWMQEEKVKVTEDIKLDLREGGEWQFTIVALKDKRRVTVKGKYLEINRPEKLVFTWRAPWTHDHPTKVTIHLTDLGEKTDLYLLHEDFPDEQGRDANFNGWNSIIGNLDNINQYMNK